MSYCDVPTLQAVTGWSRGYIWRLACRDRWRRAKVGRTVKYHWEDVARTIERRDKNDDNT